MTIDVRDGNGVCVLQIKGEVKLGEPTRLLREKSRELVAGGTRFFVLDMLDVPWLDSSGIGEVFACYKRARQLDGIVKLVLKDKSYSLFTMTQLDKVFEIFGEVDKAVGSFGATPT
jgi:anti-sigma B factor antagonist